MPDITYCINAGCPFKDCERHLSKASGQYVNVANFDGVCRRYIGHLLNELNEEDGKE